MEGTDVELSYYHKYPAKKGGLLRPALLIFLAVLVCFSSAAMGGYFVYRYLAAGEKAAPTLQPQDTPVFGPAAISDESVVNVASKVSPSVVTIRNVFFKQINQMDGQQVGQIVGEGSGVIYSDHGYIITNYHVVEHADPKNAGHDEIICEVILADDTEHKAVFIGSDPKTDLAVIKIDLAGQSLATPEFGNSDQLKVGQLAVAIGNPLGSQFAGSVTSGIDRKSTRLNSSH